MKQCFLYLLMVGGLGACIQSEPLNAEADITACKILNAKGSPETNIKGNIIINNTQVLAQMCIRDRLFCGCNKRALTAFPYLVFLQQFTD